MSPERELRKRVRRCSESMPLHHTVPVRDDVGCPHVDELRAAVEAALTQTGVLHAVVELAVVGDAAIRELNRSWLKHDYPTDVLSFLLEPESGTAAMEGQLFVNPEYAAREAPGHAWPPHELPAATRELMLYAAHGALHLCGLDDATDAGRVEMRNAEAAALAACGVAVPADHAC